MPDFLIIGAGIVGLTVALELRRRSPGATIVVLEKEAKPGLHSSGRNSGVLHSGIYYPSGSLKAKLCGEGALQMAQFCTERRLPLNRIGKVLVPTRAEDAPALGVLADRARENGVAFERLDSAALRKIEPNTRSATGEALFVPGTSVVSSAHVMAALVRDAIAEGIEIRCGGVLGWVQAERRELEWAGERVAYGHVVNAAGLHADSVAHKFGVGSNFTLLPFKGIYWKLDSDCGIAVNHLIYPVPDPRFPFLGIHTTTSVDGTVYLGPTAVPAFGRENYRGLDGVTAGEIVRISRLLVGQFVGGRDGFRRLAWQEGRRFSKAHFAKAARSLLPRLRPHHLLPCDKVGIRAQMFDVMSERLVTDFVVEAGPASTHVLNAISPAFTSSLPLARYICDNNIMKTKEHHAA